MKLALRRKRGKLGGVGGGLGGSTMSRSRYTMWDRMGLGGCGSFPERDSGGDQSHSTFCVCVCACVCVCVCVCVCMRACVCMWVLSA